MELGRYDFTYYYEETAPSNVDASKINSIPDTCVRENSLSLSGYSIGFWCTRLLVRLLPGPYINAMHLFICFFVTVFVRKSM